MAASSASTLKRLQKEVAMAAGPTMPEACSAAPDGDDLHKWKGCIAGPKNTPFANGRFQFRITLPQDYPFHPPSITLLTKTYHPNVNNDDGSICLDIIRDDEWRPTCTVRDVIQAIFDLFNTPNPDHALDAEIGDVYINDKKKWEKTAREWTKKYASK